MFHVSLLLYEWSSAVCDMRGVQGGTGLRSYRMECDGLVTQDVKALQDDMAMMIGDKSSDKFLYNSCRILV